jgi:L-cysteine S-thiosulfotransferase
MAVAGGLASCAPPIAHPPATVDTRQSGYHAMSAALRSLQDDDTQNPAFLWVEDGRQRFDASCSRCHGPAARQVDPAVARRYPAFDSTSSRPITLAGRIQQCHTQHMGVPAPSQDSDALLALESFLAFAARGRAIAPPDDPRLQPHIAQGQRWWNQRMGQIDLSCADCHDRLAGQRLAGSTIPQGHPTGYPIYRLEWQGMGSLQRRLRGCLVGVRAEPFPVNDPAWIELELYLKQRAAGMTMDAPAVRP